MEKSSATTSSSTPTTASTVTQNIKPEESTTKTVRIVIQKEHTKDVAFTVKRNVPLGKVIAKYLTALGFAQNVFKFHYLGKEFRGFDTPESLGMDDVEDVIDCWADQYGGSINKRI